MFKFLWSNKIQIGPLTPLTHATLYGTPGLRNREWQQHLEGLSCLISAPLLTKAVSALNGCLEMEEQLFGLQPQDRQHDSSEQEQGECTMFLSVCLRGEKPQRSRYLLPTSRVISPSARSLKDIHIHRNTHTQRMQRLESLAVRAFCLSLNELKYAMCVYLCACERACDRKTAGDREQWPVTYWQSQDTSIRRTGAYMPSLPSNPACRRTEKACFVSRPPALSSDPFLKSHPEWQPERIVSFFPVLHFSHFSAVLSGLACTFKFKWSFCVSLGKQITFAPKCFNQKEKVYTQTHTNTDTHSEDTQ